MGVLQICDRLLVVDKCCVLVQWENLYVTANYYLIFRLCPTEEKHPNIFKIEKTCTHKILCPIESQSYSPTFLWSEMFKPMPLGMTYSS